MGEWSDAIEDGIICSICKLPLGGGYNPPGTICEGCREKGLNRSTQDQPGTRNNPFGRRKQ